MARARSYCVCVINHHEAIHTTSLSCGYWLTTSFMLVMAGIILCSAASWYHWMAVRSTGLA